MEKEQIRIKQIFRDHWDEFLKLVGDCVRCSVKEAVEKMLACETHLKAASSIGVRTVIVRRLWVSPASRFCTSCGKVYVDNWVEKMSKEMLNVRDRHVVFTIAEELRDLFLKDRKLLKELSDLAAEVILSWWRERYKKGGIERESLR